MEASPPALLCFLTGEKILPLLCFAPPHFRIQFRFPTSLLTQVWPLRQARLPFHSPAGPGSLLMSPLQKDKHRGGENKRAPLPHGWYPVLQAHLNAIGFDTLHPRHFPYVAHEHHLRQVVLRQEVLVHIVAQPPPRVLTSPRITGGGVCSSAMKNTSATCPAQAPRP